MNAILKRKILPDSKKAKERKKAKDAAKETKTPEGSNMAARSGTVPPAHVFEGDWQSVFSSLRTENVPPGQPTNKVKNKRKKRASTTSIDPSEPSAGAPKKESTYKKFLKEHNLNEKSTRMKIVEVESDAPGLTRIADKEEEALLRIPASLGERMKIMLVDFVRAHNAVMDKQHQINTALAEKMRRDCVQALILKCENESRKAELDELRQELKELTDINDDLLSDKVQLISQVNGHGEKIDELELYYENLLRTEKNSSDVQAAELLVQQQLCRRQQVELNELKMKMEHVTRTLNEQKKAAEDQLKSIQRECETKVEQMSEKLQYMKEIEAELAQATAELKSTNISLLEYANKIKEDGSQLEDLKSQVAEMQMTITRCQNQGEQDQTEIERLKEENLKREADKASLNEVITKIKTNNIDLIEDKKALAQQLKEATDKFDKEIQALNDLNKVHVRKFQNLMQQKEYHNQLLECREKTIKESALVNADLQSLLEMAKTETDLRVEVHQALQADFQKTTERLNAQVKLQKQELALLREQVKNNEKEIKAEHKRYQECLLAEKAALNQEIEALKTGNQELIGEFEAAKQNFAVELSSKEDDFKKRITEMLQEHLKLKTQWDKEMAEKYTIINDLTSKLNRVVSVCHPSNGVKPTPQLGTEIKKEKANAMAVRPNVVKKQVSRRRRTQNVAQHSSDFESEDSNAPIKGPVGRRMSKEDPFDALKRSN